jgi:GT2 family glycosyltransferase
MKPLVYIIILNWNGRDLTLDCLDSISKVKYENSKVLVVDNNSEDDSVKNISGKFPEVEVLELDKNYGYADGNNKGFESINNQNVDYVLFLNNDTIVDMPIAYCMWAIEWNCFQ